MKGMRKRPPILLLGCLLLLLACGFFPDEASGANKVLDVKMARGADGRTRLALLLQQKPGYTLSCTRGGQISLDLSETAAAATLSKAVAREGKSLQLEVDGTSRSLRMTVALKASPREVECSWMAKEKVLLIDIAETREAPGKALKIPKQASLKGLRFGVQEGLTRMVADLSARPAWAMTSRDDRVFLFQLRGASTSLQRSAYGPMKRLKSVTLSRKGEDLEIKADPEAAMERIRVLWLKEGGKWVVDFFDRAPDKMDTALRFENRKDPEPEKPKAPAIAEAPKGTDSVVATRPEEKKTQPRASDAESGVTISGGQSAMVRMKIEKPEEAAPRGKGKESQDLKVEPKVRFALPEAPADGNRISTLKPAEAILFGRIREALDLKDYEKAAALIEEFLRTFPDSSLAEEMMFLAGDCRFALMEKGDKTLIPKVIATYQDAISKFMKSEKVPEAFVRMARAHDLAGNDQEALGLLTVAINRHPTGDHLPGALVARGRIYLRLNQPQRAIEDFKAVIQRFPDSPLVAEAHYGIAGYYHGVGMYDDAEAKLKSIIEANPGFYQEHPEFLSLRARNYFYRKNYDLARDQYFRALNLGRQPEGSDLLISHIGDTYFHQSREKEAAVFYRMADLYYPDTEGAGIGKLRIADQSTGVSAYEEVYRKNIDKPIGDLAVLEMASKFYKRGQYAPAAENLRKLAAKQHVQSDVQREARQLLFRCAEKEIRSFYDSGQYERVADYFQSAVPSLSGNVDPETMLLVGESFSRIQKNAEAVRVFSQLSIRELSPESRGRYVVDFARLHLSQGEDEGARELLESAAGEKLLPADQQRASLLLAEVYQKRGDMKRASELYQALLSEKRLLSDREMAGLYLGLGKANNRLNLYEKAREALNRSIALSEKDRQSRELLRTAYLEMANSYHSEGKHQEAVRYYGQCLDLDYNPQVKGYWDVKYKLALSYLGTGEHVMAERIMNEIAEEGDPALQQRVQMKMGLMSLEKELKRLPIGKKSSDGVL